MVDGDLITGHFSQLVQEGHLIDVPIVIGYVTDRAGCMAALLKRILM